MDIKIINGSVVSENGVSDRALAISDGKIIPSDSSNADVVIDAANAYVMPGFIDCHVHGGGGYDFMDLSEDGFRTIINTHLQHGTTSIMPTTLSAPLEEIAKFLDMYKRMAKENLPATLLGVHLEGPFLSPKQSGAQSLSMLVPPNDENCKFLADRGMDVISRIDIAPELEGAMEAGDFFSKNGKVVSIAHSNALFPCVKESLDHGYSFVTHMFCAAPWARKIDEKVQAGIPEAAYLFDEMGFELIGDGLHIAPQTIEMAAKFKSKNKVLLVTDAMRAAGTDVTESYLGAICPENRVIIEGGVAKLPDRSSFAGSIATMDSVFKNVYLNTDLPIYKIAEFMSLAPAYHAGVQDHKGKIADGMDADIVIVDKATGELMYVIAMGQIVKSAK